MVCTCTLNHDGNALRIWPEITSRIDRPHIAGVGGALAATIRFGSLGSRLKPLLRNPYPGKLFVTESLAEFRALHIPKQI